MYLHTLYSTFVCIFAEDRLVTRPVLISPDGVKTAETNLKLPGLISIALH